ncbi:MAG: hypothetical protein R3C11_00975 [Planctomycetaceae bacterium]
MGNFSKSLHVRTSDSTKISNLVQEYLLQIDEHVEDVIEEYPDITYDEDYSAAILISQPTNGWVGLLCNLMFEDHLLAEFITQKLNVPAILFTLEDSDFWGYQLYENGIPIDEYNSYELFGSGQQNVYSFGQEFDSPKTIDPTAYDCTPHFENLKKLSVDFTEEHLQSLLTKKNAFAESILVPFMKQLKIPEFYGTVMYDNLEEYTPEELEEMNIRYEHHWVSR